MSIAVWLFGLVDPDLLGMVQWSGRSADEAIWVSRVGDIERPLAVLADGGRQAVVDHGGSHHSDSGVAMIIVIPGEELLTESAAVLDATESVGKLGAVLHGAKLAF